MKLVSAILPTRGRQAWAAQALQCFLSQTYEPKNLFIVDDADEPSFPDFMNYTNIGRVVLNDRLSIGAKRNIGARLATGELIMHLDSDDWSSRQRMRDQVKLLTESDKAVCGFHSILFHDDHSGHYGKYRGDRGYALGTSLLYTKDWWKDHPFNESLMIGEDNEFTYQANQAGQLVSVDGCGLIVARVHPGNTSPKNISDYDPTSVALPAGFIS